MPTGSFSLPTGSPPPSGLGGEGIVPAIDAVTDIRDYVERRITSARIDALSLRDDAQRVLDELSSLNLEVNLPDPPTAPAPSFDFTYTPADVAPPSVGDFGDINLVLPVPPTFSPIPDVDTVDIPEFAPSVIGFNLPSAPVIASPGVLPDAPTVGTVDMPDAPSVVMPSVPTLDNINLPTFDVSTLPELTADSPEFVGTPVSQVFNWAEPTYLPEIIGDVARVLRDMWGGRLGIPAAVENAIWERAQEREDLQTERDVSQVFRDFSGRGFTIPPGGSVERVAQLRDEASRRKAALNRDITIEVAKVHVDNVRHAVTTGVATEGVYLNIHNNAAQRMFEAEKARVDLQLNMYNAQVAVFNGKVNLFREKVAEFNARLAARIDIFKAQLSAELAKGERNKLLVEVYDSQTRAVQATVSVYEAQVRAASEKTKALGLAIDQYRVQVQAYAERVNAAKLPLDVYKTMVDAESSKAGLVDAEARAYAALISGRKTGIEVQLDYAKLVGMRNDQSLQQYTAVIAAERAKMETQGVLLESTVKAYMADVDRFRAEVSRDQTVAETRLRAEEASERLGIANFEARVAMYEAQMRLITERSNQTIASIKAAGDIASTLAAGAMAGVSVGANISGSGQIVGSGSSSFNESLSFQQGVSENRSIS